MIRSRSKVLGATLGYVRTAPTGVPDVVTQENRIRSACEELGLRLVDTLRDGEHDRPSLRHAFERIAAGDAGCIMVCDLTALGPGVRELADVMGRIERDSVRLIALDVGLDTATPTGRLALGADQTWWPADPEPEPPG